MSSKDGVLYGPVCKLKRVMEGKEDGCDVLCDQPLEALHGNKSIMGG